MASILQRISGSQIQSDPFPHVIVEHALDDSLCEEMIRRLPSLPALTRMDKWGSNQRFNYSAVDAAIDHALPAVWKQFIAQHVSQDFLRQVIELFRPQILREFPDFEERFGSLAELRAGVRGIDTYAVADVLLDAQIGINTPVQTASSVRGPHLDQPTKLFAGLLYLRADEDDSTGGDLQICSVVTRRPPGKDLLLSWSDIRVEATVPYRKNTLVMFLNTPRSFHAVGVRSPTRHPRVFVNFVGVMRESLFSIEQREQMRRGLRGTGSRLIEPIRRLLAG